MNTKFIKMKDYLSCLLLILMISSQFACGDEYEFSPLSDTVPSSGIRVPAEWEPHASTWIQWANEYNSNVLKVFAYFIKTVQQYEQVNLIVYNEKDKEKTIEFFEKQGVADSNLIYHVSEIDNSWMRDNGPIYVTNGEKTWIQNWKFNGWGGGFGKTPYKKDNEIPSFVANILDLNVENHLDYVLEKGNIEVNGKGILAIGWDCQNHRNPGLTKEQHEKILKKHLGVHKIIWAYGHFDGDGTIGHIDGVARFINENTMVICDYASERETQFAEDCKKQGLEVIWFSGDVNWLVGNGFVAIMGDGYNDENEKETVESFFPGRNVHIIPANALMRRGGGLHCISNDEPLVE